jgi:hypothetical protein
MAFSIGFMWKYIGICEMNKQCFPSCYSENNNSLTVTATGTGILLVHCMCVYDSRCCVILWWKLYGITKYMRCSRFPTPHFVSYVLTLFIGATSDLVRIPSPVATCRWVDNIRMDLQKVGCGYGDWIGLAQDRDRWRTLVSAVMNLRVP